MSILLLLLTRPFWLLYFIEASTVQETLTDGVHKLERSIENLNVRLARLLAEYSASQAKLKQRIAKLELRWAIQTNFHAKLTHGLI